jgi:uncharacterized delta-60 repeat protein/uncharacterized repeat protein (TIGR01451 family)
MKKSFAKSNRSRRIVRLRFLLSVAFAGAMATVVAVPFLSEWTRTAHAAGSVSLNAISVPVSQNFDSLTNGANDTISSAGIPTGWDFSESLANANTSYRTGTGSGNTGDTYSFGTPTTSTDRAFGQLRSGTCASILGASFTNNTGNTLTGLAISYAGEQWRIGATSHSPTPEKMDFQYSTNATNLTVGTYVDFDALDFTPPITSAGAAGALDGNNSANRKIITSTITGLSIANGATFWIRWNDVDASGSDDGLAIDDFSITPLGGSIGANGYRTTDVAATDDGGYAMVLQPDGKIVVGGYAVNGSQKDFALVRYNYNGSLDTTFNGTGKVTTDISGAGRSDRIWGLALQSDGKIVAAGEVVNLAGNNDIAVARYNSNGTLDTAGFGVGTGIVTTDHGVPGTNNSAYGVALQGTSIVVAGAEVVSGNYDFMAARYTSAGVLDVAGFGTAGVTTVGFSGGNDVARAIAIDGSSRILLGGYSNGGSGDDFAIARLTSGGVLDTTFVAGAGKAALDLASGGPNSADQAFSMGIDGAGRIILGGSTYNNSTGNKDFAFVCYTSTGALDTSGFGGGTGIVRTDFSNSPDVAQAIQVRSDGSFIAGGFSRYPTSSDDFAVASYNSSGGPDNSFDNDGKLTFKINNWDERIYGIAQEFDGKIVVAGFASSSATQHDFAVARFSSTGAIDSTNATTLNSPDLLTTKTGPQGPNTVIAGQNFTYTITVENRGGAAASNVVITDVLPGAVTYVSHVASNGSSTGAETVTNDVGLLNPGATATLTITVTASNTPQLVANTATATMVETDPTPANNAATEYTRIIGILDLSFSPSTVTGGCQNSTGTVTLSGQAPFGGATVNITSADPAAASAPAQVTVLQGQTSAQFPVTTYPVAINKQVRFQVDLGPTTFVRRINVNAGCN